MNPLNSLLLACALLAISSVAWGQQANNNTLPAANGIAQAENQTEPQSPTIADAKPEATANSIRRDPFPATARIRRIYFLQSQASNLLPRSYWPVDLSELEAALAKQNEIRRPGEQRPQITNAVYVARFDGTSLISEDDASLLDIAYDGTGTGALRLGDVNLALREPSSPAMRNQNARLVSGDDGALRLLADRDARLRFGWSRRGELAPDGRYFFDLRIPASGRTRLLVGVPPSFRIESLDGVLANLPSPPPEAVGASLEGAQRWYAVEAGGTERVRLSVVPTNVPPTASRQYTVRGLGIDATATIHGLEWTARFVVDIPRGELPPPLQVASGGRITSVRVNGEAAVWRETVDADSSRVSFDRVISNAESSSLAAVIEIAGVNYSLLPAADTTSTPAENNTTDTPPTADRLTAVLPWISLDETGGIWVASQTLILLRVESKLELAEVDSLGPWKLSANSGDNTSSRREYQLTGPPTQAPPRMRFSAPRIPRRCRAALRLAIREEQTRANWQGVITLAAESPRPLRFELQPGWRVDSVSIRGSGRLIESPEEEISQGQFTIWPEAADIVDGKMRLQITGAIQADVPRPVEALSPTWFIRLLDEHCDVYTAIVPPAEYQWEPGTALRGRWMVASEIPADISELLGPLVADTLVTASHGLPTPALSLKRPPADYSSDVSLDIRVEEGEVVERLRVAIRIPSVDSPPLRIRLGEPGGRPPMRWDVEDGNPESGSAETVRATQVLDDVTIGEVWDFVAENPSGETIILNGRRRYPVSVVESSNIAEPTSPDFLPTVRDPATGSSLIADIEHKWNIALPTVFVSSSSPGTTHRGVVTIGPRLRPVTMTGNVLKVPSVRASVAASSSSGTAPASPPTNQSTIAERPVDWTLRFAPDEEASLLLAKDETPLAPPVIWRQSVDILAGLSGDELVVDFQVDGGRSFVIDHEPGMNLMRVEGARVVESPTVGTVTITPNEPNEIVRVRWWRPQRVVSRWRRFEAPRIDVKAVVLRTEWRLWSATDSFALTLGTRRDAPGWMSAEATGVVTLINPNDSIPLIGSTFGWAMAGGIALLAFALAWWLLAHRPSLGVALLILMIVIAVFTPVWANALLAFVILPWVVAGLFVSGVVALPHRVRRGTVISRAGTTRQGDGRASGSASVDARASTVARKIDSRLGSAGARSARLLPWLLFISGAGTTFGQGTANDRTGSPSEPPINILIPVTPSGDLSGNKVYVPQGLLDTLFRRKDQSGQFAKVEFQSADYQARVTSLGMSGSSDQLEIEATWRVEVDSTEFPARLPVAPENIERLEVVIDGVPNEVRPIPDRDGVFWRAPRTGSLILRADLTLDAEPIAAGANRAELAIPPVARSSITVTAESPFEQVSLPNCLGKVTRSDSGNRVSGMLGAVPKLELIWQRRGVSTISALSELNRRWWIHVGVAFTARELELDIGDGVRAGVVVEIESELTDLPMVTTADWALAASDLSDPNETRLRLIATVDSPGPIRLLWSTSTPAESSFTVSIPDVRPVGYRTDIPTTIGVDAPTGWRFPDFENAADGDSISSNVDPATFAKEWKGFAGNVGQARRYVTSMPTALRIAQDAVPIPDASESHHVIVHANFIAIEYQCTIDPIAGTPPPTSLRLPSGLRVDTLTVNGENVEGSWISGAQPNQAEILLPALLANTPTTVQLQGAIDLSPSDVFRPPLIRLHGVEIASIEYLLSQIEGIRLQSRETPNLPLQPGDPPIQEYDPTLGLIPAESWLLDPTELGDALALPAEFTATPYDPVLTATSLATLRWDDGLWTMEVVFDIEFLVGESDFLTFEVPARWVDGLDVSPARKYSQRPSGQSSFLLRVLPSPEALIEKPLQTPTTTEATSDNNSQHLRLRIRSTLDSAGDGGVVVPDVRLLGTGPRQRFFAVPRRLTSNAIDWRTQNSRQEDRPARFAEFGPDDTTHQYYEVLGETFAANLQPSPVGAGQSRAPLLEVNLFPRDQASVIALLRLHLIPGNRDAVRFQLPNGAKPIGAWASGMAMAVEPTELKDQISVPLGLSRLAQQLVLLVQLPITDDEGPLKIPTLVDLPVDSTWVARYDDQPSMMATRLTTDGSSPLTESLASAPARSVREARKLFSQNPPSAPWQAATPDEYRSHIAASVMSILDASVDSVAERASNEKRRWLRPWFGRLRQLGWPSNGQFIPAIGSTNSGSNSSTPASVTPPTEANTATTEQGTPLTAEPSDVWTQLDSWAPRLLQRVFGNEAAGNVDWQEEPVGTWLLAPAHWAPTQIIHAEQPVDMIPAGMAPLHEPEYERYAGLGWSLAITGGIWGLIAFGMLVWGWTITLKPYVWLLLLSIVTLPFAPLPVSLAAMLIAFAGPILERRR